MTVLVVMGGESAERPISIQSGTAVARALLEAERAVEVVLADPGGWWRRVDLRSTIDSRGGVPLHGARESPAGVIADVAPSVVFPTLHGPLGEDGTMQGQCRVLGVPFVGSDVLSSAVCMDKLTAKRLAAAHGIAQTSFVPVPPDGRSPAEVDARRLRPPLFVKPSNMGSSIGITRVTDRRELPPAIELARRFDSDVIIEEGVDGDEVSCGVLGAPGAAGYRLSPLKYSATRRNWLDFDAKYAAGRPLSVIPAPLSPEQTAQVTRVARQVAVAFRIDGMARVDFFVEHGTERLLLNEVNTLPGFTERSSFPRMWAAEGLSMLDLIDELCSLAQARHRRRRASGADQ